MRIQTKMCQVGTGTRLINSEEDLKVVEYLGGKAVYGNTVADKIYEEFYRALPSGH
jgi:hypothetical protein